MPRRRLAGRARSARNLPTSGPGLNTGMPKRIELRLDRRPAGSAGYKTQGIGAKRRLKQTRRSKRPGSPEPAAARLAWGERKHEDLSIIPDRPLFQCLEAVKKSSSS